MAETLPRGSRVQISDRTRYNGRMGWVTGHNMGEIGVTFTPTYKTPATAEAWFRPDQLLRLDASR